MFKGNPMKMVFALTKVLINVPRLPGLIFKTLTSIKATTYPKIVARPTYTNPLESLIKRSTVRYSITDTNIDAGKAMFIINFEMLSLKLTSNHFLICRIYPSEIKITTGKILSKDCRKTIKIT